MDTRQLGLRILAFLSAFSLLAPVKATELALPVCLQGMNYQCGLLSRQGKWLVEPQFAKLRASENRWISTSHAGLYGILDQTGQPIKLASFLDLSDYTQGYAVAQDVVSELWGVIDQQGNWHIAPAYSTGRLVQQQLYLFDKNSLRWQQITAAGKPGKRLRELPSQTYQYQTLPELNARYKDWAVTRGFSNESQTYSPPYDVYVASYGKTTHFLDARQQLLFEIQSTRTCDGIDRLLNAQGKLLWPLKLEALCWLKANQFASQFDAPAHLKGEVEGLWQAHLRQEAQADRERMQLAQGAPFPFMRRLPYYQELKRIYGNLPQHAAGQLELLPGLSVATQENFRYLPASQTQAFLQQLAVLEQMHQTPPDAKTTEAGVNASKKIETQPQKKQGEPEKQQEFALIIAPDRRWQAQIYFLPGYLSKHQQLDAAAILASAKQRRFFQLGSLDVDAQLQASSLRWVLEPHYDEKAQAYISAESIRSLGRQKSAIYYLLPGNNKTVVVEVKWQGLDAQHKAHFYLDEVREQLRHLNFDDSEKTASAPNQGLRLSAHELFAGPGTASYKQFQLGMSAYFAREEIKSKRLRSDLIWGLLPLVLIMLLLLFSRSGKS